MCAKIAWVDPPITFYPSRFWLEEKRDSMQYAIEEIAKEHDVLHLAPTSGESQRVDEKCLYTNADEALQALISFYPDIINLNLFGATFNSIVGALFPKSFITLYDHGGNCVCSYSKYVDVFFTNLEFRRKLIINKNGVSPEKVILNPHGADPNQFYPDDSVEKIYTGIMVADFRRRKRQHLNITNWVRVEGKLLLVGRTSPPLGDPVYTEECRALIERLGLSENVEIKDFVPHSELPRLINSAEIGINLSLGGAGSRSTTEMMMCGLPMVVSKNRYSEDWVKSGGLKEAAPNKIGLAVNHLKNSPIEYKLLREAVLKTIKPYTYDGMLDTFKKVIEWI